MQQVFVDDRSPRINYTLGWFSVGPLLTDYNQWVTISCARCVYADFMIQCSTVTACGFVGSGYSFTFNGTLSGLLAY